jgi:hypothetical protein
MQRIPDSCANTASTTIVVNAPERAYFDYPDSVLCLGAAAELPLIQYLPSSGGFSMVIWDGYTHLGFEYRCDQLGNLYCRILRMCNMAAFQVHVPMMR